MPFSWELVQQQQNSVVIATPLPRPAMVSPDWAYAFAVLQKPGEWDWYKISNLPFGEARTQLVYLFLQTNRPYMFFLDSDVVPPPDALVRLMSHKLPIVSGIYHQKFPTWTGFEVKYMPCIFNEGRDDKGNPTRTEVQFQYGQLVQCDYVPAGCLLVHRSVFERMLQAGIKRFFEWTMHVPDQPTGRSEDFEACARWKSLGYKIFCDSGIQCIHETEGKVDIRGLQPKI